MLDGLDGDADLEAGADLECDETEIISDLARFAGSRRGRARGSWT
ncbi:MAG: hypothetical protein P0Y66_03725 [Candidatus Kaistia colombiensis]|nr:MAG: hypothetical protein P0Y66_03725 [Kaistia sp.]